MKYQLLNGWTPHSFFAVWVRYTDTSGILCGRLWRLGPFNEEKTGEVYTLCFSAKNTHEALARWLVANTEGDW